MHSDYLVTIVTPQRRCVLLGNCQASAKKYHTNIQMATKSTILKITLWNFSRKLPFHCSFQKYNFCMGEKAKDRWKSKVKTGKIVIFLGNQEQFFQFRPGGMEVPLLHILDRNYPFFYLKCPRKYKEIYNFDIIPKLFQICASPLQF